MRRPLSLVFVDLDHFKLVNDRYGHEEGDRVLHNAAEALQKTLRQSDIVVRWGGEEFLVVIGGDVAQGVALLEDAKAALGARHFKLRETDQPMGRISFSAGVAALPRRPEALAAAIEQADALLYLAKSEGRDRVLGVDALSRLSRPVAA